MTKLSIDPNKSFWNQGLNPITMLPSQKYNDYRGMSGIKSYPDPNPKRNN